MYGNRRTSASALPSLPPGAQRPAVYSDAYTVEVTPPAYEQHVLQNPWDLNTPPLPPPRPRVRSMNESRTHHGQNQIPYDSMRQQRVPFPEPVFYGQQSNLASSSQRLVHHHSRSELGILSPSSTDYRKPHNDSVSSFASSYNAHNDYLASSKEVGTLVRLYFRVLTRHGRELKVAKESWGSRWQTYRVYRFSYSFTSHHSPRLAI